VSPRSRDVLRVIYLICAQRAGIVSTGGQITSRKFPNLARTALQYFGVPATSATVERLFSVVGFAFADRRKRASAAETPANLAVAKLNLPTGLQNFNYCEGAHVTVMTFGSSLSSNCDLHDMR